MPVIRIGVPRGLAHCAERLCLGHPGSSAEAESPGVRHPPLRLMCEPHAADAAVMEANPCYQAVIPDLPTVQAEMRGWLNITRDDLSD